MIKYESVNVKYNLKFTQSKVKVLYISTLSESEKKGHLVIPVLLVLKIGHDAVNLFVLLGLDALLVDCRFPCVWMKLTIVSRGNRLRSARLTAVKRRGCCS